MQQTLILCACALAALGLGLLYIQLRWKDAARGGEAPRTRPRTQGDAPRTKDRTRGPRREDDDADDREREAGA